MSDPRWPKRDGKPLAWRELTPAQKDVLLRAAWARFTEEQRDVEVTKELAGDRT